MMPARIESLAERRTDLALFERIERRRQRAGAEHERQILRLLLREAAGNPRFSLRDPRLDDRRRPHGVVEDDRELLVDVRFGHARELGHALVVQA